MDDDLNTYSGKNIHLLFRASKRCQFMEEGNDGSLNTSFDDDDSDCVLCVAFRSVSVYMW